PPTAESLWVVRVIPWMMEEEPELWKKAHKYLMLSAYLHSKLVGKYIDSISGQTGRMPLQYKKQKWDSRLGMKSQIFQIPKRMLYPIVPARTVLGKITKEASRASGISEGIPVIAAGSDKACETLGVGCVDSFTASVSLGSQATVQINTKDYFEVLKFIPPFPSVIPQYFSPEITVYRGFWMISWFKELFKSVEDEADEKEVSTEEIYNRKLNTIPAGSDGLLLQPFWGNEVKRPESRGAIIGFKENHSGLHIYKAIIEGIGFALREGIDKIEQKTKTDIQRIGISGGGSSSDEICQIMADIFNKPVHKVQTAETSALGAAICGFVGLGVYPDFPSGVDGMVRYERTYEPDPKTKEKYERLYQGIYVRIYGKLQALYKELEKIESGEQ
ncbi:MAG TPA: hypothetical protein DHN33_03660, partial [Eubacteriaceae bacterium]|nr:hypothetical protein [Eubacteriaceae bacterium]